LKAFAFPSGFDAPLRRLSLRPGNDRVLQLPKEIDMNSIVTFRCTALALGALACGPALADAPAEPATTVKFGDLNLNSTEAVATLYQRIERAADQVCQMPRGTLQLKLESELKACRRDATDRAILQANVPALSALHLARTGRKADKGQYADRR
jgi:UrcA family protein